MSCEVNWMSSGLLDKSIAGKPDSDQTYPLAAFVSLLVGCLKAMKFFDFNE
jgi:hypothetical protein